MLKELWQEHRSKVCAAAGTVLFLSAGAATTLLPSAPEPEVQQVQEIQQVQQEPALVTVELPKTPTAPVEIPLREKPEPQKKPAPPAEAKWYVYITGRVRKPGVYPMSPGSRIFHLVKAAGGMDDFADEEAVNLSEPLKDGQHVHIPLVGERRAKEGKTTTSKFSGQSAKTTTRQTSSQQTTQTKPTGPIDINHAPVEVLVHLRGVGPSLAKRIVEYRQKHGPFHSVEDLIQVRGIGASKVKGLRDQATVKP